MGGRGKGKGRGWYKSKTKLVGDADDVFEIQTRWSLQTCRLPRAAGDAEGAQRRSRLPKRRCSRTMSLGSHQLPVTLPLGTGDDPMDAMKADQSTKRAKPMTVGAGFCCRLMRWRALRAAVCSTQCFQIRACPVWCLGYFFEYLTDTSRCVGDGFPGCA